MGSPTLDPLCLCILCLGNSVKAEHIVPYETGSVIAATTAVTQSRPQTTDIEQTNHRTLFHHFLLIANQMCFKQFIRHFLIHSQ